MKFLSLVILALAVSGNVFACSEDGKSGIVEENTLNIPVGVKRNGGITEQQFNAVISKIETIYVPIAKSMGGNLKIARKWSDGTVNANATRLFGTWAVNMYGGLARHETITEDGFALVLCHEIGHQMGGAPKVGNLLMKWASNEGQSDYWATAKCLRRVFMNDNNAAVLKKLKAKIPATLANACAKAHGDKIDQDICIRSGMAGDSVSALFASIRKQPRASFDTPDRSKVSKTNDAHPAFQCRLDTYFMGAICEVAFNEDVDQKDEVRGTCHKANGHEIGLRPTCWFKPSK